MTMKTRVSVLILAVLFSACAEDTRRPFDAGALPDAVGDAGPGIDTGPGNDAGPSDGDMDGVRGSMDLCPATAAGETVDANGCSTLDDDADGVLNDMDRCPETAAGANVDGLGCPLENQGTLDASWLINGAAATSATCSAVGVAQVRLIIDRPGSNFLMRDFPCAQGGFDGREDETAPQVPRNMSFMSYWQAVSSAGEVVSESETLSLILSGEVEHASLASPNFIFE